MYFCPFDKLEESIAGIVNIPFKLLEITIRKAVESLQKKFIVGAAFGANL